VLSIPAEVAALLGPGAEDRSGEGAGAVLAGNGHVARIGPPEVVAREAFVLGLDTLPVARPALVAAGVGWVVTKDVADHEGGWSNGDLHGALADLGRLHDHYESALPAGADAVLRHPFDGVTTDGLLAGARPHGDLLPPLLARLLAEPAPLLDVLGREPVTLLHGDPWPANIRRPGPGRRVWVDWEQASTGPAAADLATWLDQTPWYLRREVDTGEHLAAYLAARRRPADPVAFRRAVDAASVVWFLAFDVPRLPGAPPWLAEHMVGAKDEAASRVLG
jgi:Predicted choline kinase involved in LPS biosynthesis